MPTVLRGGGVPRCSSAACQELLSLTHQGWPSCVRLLQGTAVRAFDAGCAGGCWERCPDAAEVSSAWTGVGDLGVCLKNRKESVRLDISLVRLRGRGREGEAVLL